MSSPGRQWGEPVKSNQLNAHYSENGSRGMFLWNDTLRHENHDVEPHPIRPIQPHEHGWGPAVATVAEEERQLNQQRRAMIEGHDRRQLQLTTAALNEQRAVMPSDSSSGGARWTRGLLAKAEQAGRAASELEHFSQSREDWRRGYERDERVVFMSTESGPSPIYRPSTHGINLYGTYRHPYRHGRNTYLDCGVPSRSVIINHPSERI